MNLTALAVADVRGAPLPPPRRARRTATWCQPLDDVRAARQAGVSLARWARFAARCDTFSSLSLADPMPFVRGRVLASLRPH